MKVYINQFVGPTTLQSLPMAAGLLAASVKKDPRLHTVDIEIVTARIDPAAALQRYVEPDVLAFSCYAWNERYTLEIVRRCRDRFPGVLTVLGGPAVPRRNKAIQRHFKKNVFVDVLVLGEGELSFLDLLATHLECAQAGRTALHAIQGLAVRGHTGAEPVVGAARPRMQDFSRTGSPYLDGTFDTLLETQNPPVNMAVLETNRGCPFSCTFCDWGQATQSEVYELPEARVQAELDWVGDHEVPFLYFIDANFGIRKRDVHIIEYLTRVKQRTGFPTLCYFHLTKNASERNLRTVELLKEADIQCRMALSMQDFSPDVLKAIRRSNIQPKNALRMRALCHEKDIPTFNELILGLPWQTYEAFCSSVVQAMTPYPTDTFSLYLCQLLENSEMASPAQRAMYALDTVVCVTRSTDPHYRAHVDEFEELVISTSVMPAADWRQAYRFGYLVSVCYNFNLLRVVLHDLQFVHHIDMVAWFEALLEAMNRRPAIGLWGEIAGVFERYTSAILRGDAMTWPLPGMDSPQWAIEDALNLTIQTCLERFYTQVYETTLTFLRGSNPEISEQTLEALFDAQRSSAQDR